ncbi:MAG: hypothetical protein ACRDYZ_00730 [Acidimicrobiales bacterium]
MNTRLDVEVTEKDCAEGCRGNEHYCVVSTAIARLVPDANRVEVNVNTIRFSLKENGKTYRLAYRTPPPVRDYIKAFDAGHDPHPLTFVLDKPQMVEKAPAPRGKAKTPSFKPQASATTRRSVRVFGEKAFAS